MFFALLWLAAASVNPIADCEWMNTATAEGILGGAATLTVSPSSCSWTRKSAKQLTLRIEIVALGLPSPAYAKLAARCENTPTVVKNLGNEAVACRVSGSASIVGRVRDRGFVVTLTGSAPASDQRLRRAADQVAGNLF